MWKWWWFICSVCKFKAHNAISKLVDSKIFFNRTIYVGSFLPELPKNPARRNKSGDWLSSRKTVLESNKIQAREELNLTMSFSNFISIKRLSNQPFNVTKVKELSAMQHMLKGIFA